MNNRIYQSNNFFDITRLSSFGALAFALVLSTPGWGQVFLRGPSNPGLFDNVINVPSPAVGNSFSGSVGGIAGQTEQLNVNSMGSVISSTGSSFQAGIGAEVNIDGGTIGDSFAALNGSEVNLINGSIGNNFNVTTNRVDISGGTIGFWFTAGFNSEINISGGLIEDGFEALAGSEINLFGGSIGEDSSVTASLVNINGGEIGDGFAALAGSEINSEVTISGGEFTGSFQAFQLSETNLIGSGFELDGVPVSGLTPGVPRVITERDVTLSMVLADGTPFEIELNLTPNSSGDLFFSNATLTLTLSVLLGDVNQDSVVDLFDVAPFVDRLVNGVFQAEADVNQDGVVDLLDIGPFDEVLTAS